MARLSDEEREAAIRAADEEWWEDWWAADYSWEGLARLGNFGIPKHRWTGWAVTPAHKCVAKADAPEGSRLATLQDYFRWDFNKEVLRSDAAMRDEYGLLIRTEGQPDFHIFHLPERWEDGTESWKSNHEDPHWAAVDAELVRRIRVATYTKLERAGLARRQEGRALLAGAQLLALPGSFSDAGAADEAITIHMTAPLSRWLRNADFSGIDFGSALSFSGTRFSGGNADFNGAQFSGGSVDFSRAQFSGGNAYFFGTKFSGGNADFSEAQFSGGNTHFNDTRFSGGNASFRSAEFSGGDTHFNDAQFSGGYASFNNARFSGGTANFRNAQFSGGNTNFFAARFSGGYASFNDARFSGGNANFFNARFSGGNANFRNTIFGRSRLRASDLGFRPGMQPWMPSPTYNCTFDSASFEHGFQAVECRFWGPTRFRGASFHQEARFGNARQTGVSEERVRQGAVFDDSLSFRDARFRGPADFARTRFPRRADHRSGAFEGARFHDTLDMKGIERLPFSAFQGAKLDKGILIAPRHPDERDFRNALDETRSTVRRDRSVRQRDGYDAHKDADSENRGRDARFAALEKGCLVLKHAMAEISDRQREQAFHRLELIARQHRPVRLSGPLKRWEKPGARISLLSNLASRAYGLFARHGASAARPLIWLLGIGALSAALYMPLGYWADRSADRSEPALVWPCPDCELHPLWTPAFETAGRNTLAPLKFAVRRSLPFEDDLEAAPTPRLWFSLISASHSLLSLILIFLAALGLRRKFQL